MVSMGAMYYLIPRLYNRRSTAWLIEVHFWMATIGIVLYITAMWIAGIMQGLMWRAVNDRRHADLQLHRTVEGMHPYYFVRCWVALVYLLGMLLMAYNVFMTVKGGKAENAPVLAPAH